MGTETIKAHEEESYYASITQNEEVINNILSKLSLPGALILLGVILLAEWPNNHPEAIESLFNR